MAITGLNTKVEFRNMTLAQRTGLIAGVHQMVWCSWAEMLPGVVFVQASLADRVSFGPGVFRVFKGEMQEELIARIDPWAFTVSFIDNELYVNTGVVRWVPIKCKRMLIVDSNEFFAEWREPNTVLAMMHSVRTWFDDKRPVDFTPMQHARDSQVNCTSDAEVTLAKVAARLIEHEAGRHA